MPHLKAPSLTSMKLIRSQCSVGYMVTALQDGESGFRIPAGGRSIFPFPKPPDRVWDLPSLLLQGCWGSMTEFERFMSRPLLIFEDKNECCQIFAPPPQVPSLRGLWQLYIYHVWNYNFTGCETSSHSLREEHKVGGAKFVCANWNSCDDTRH
jgi:hypothetical protein